MTKPTDQKMFSISVVIPAYNAEAHLGRAIESVLNQTCLPDEIIVVDDGSTDNTAQIARQYSSSVQYVYQKNSGANEARNLGIQRARSEWIALLDADDEWLPEKLELQIALLKRNPELTWSYGNYKIAKPGQPTLKVHNVETANRLLGTKEYFEDFFDAYASKIPVHTITMIIKKDILKKVGLFLPKQILGHDPDVALRLAYRCSKAGYNPEPLAKHNFGRPEGITQRSKPLLEERLDFIRRHLEISSKYGKRKQYESCARMLLMKWVRDMQMENFSSHALELMNTFKSLLPIQFRWEKNITLRWPWMEKFFSRYHRVKNILKKNPNTVPE